MDNAGSPSTEVSGRTDENKFNSEEVIAFIKETVERELGESDYSHAKVPTWNSTVIETILTKMKEDNKNYKYVVTCVILQRNGAGFYAGSSVIWDKNNDNSAGYRHETKAMYAIINVFALRI
ncbi:Tctex-1 [Helicostylum pulchrum]|uniref:Uncharacterized protein n=1 Tax=Helicostylum pulchrum TaxID=562976 RepID=A0ABP9XPY0_9FUNG|nr:Tctex-1 [Helicostylum pulchrum]